MDSKWCITNTFSFQYCYKIVNGWYGVHKFQNTIRAIITILHLSSYVNIFFSKITMSNKKKVDRDVDLIRICDIVDNAKFNMATRTNNKFWFAEPWPFIIQNLLSGLKFNMVWMILGWSSHNILDFCANQKSKMAVTTKVMT